MADHSQLVPHKVAIVVDRELGAALSPLASHYHVWIVESLTNLPAIRGEWDKEPRDPGADPLGPGVTAFKAGPQESVEAMCARVADEVDEHHGEFGHDPPWTEIRVVGVSLGPRLEAVFRNIGAVHLDPTPQGFVCRR